MDYIGLLGIDVGFGIYTVYWRVDKKSPIGEGDSYTGDIGDIRYCEGIVAFCCCHFRRGR
jgi:hypothetical protein